MTDEWEGEPGWERIENGEAWSWGLLAYINRMIAPIGIQLLYHKDQSPLGGADELVLLASKPFRPIAVNDDQTEDDQLLSLRALQWISERLAPFVEHLVERDRQIAAEKGEQETIEIEIPPEDSKTWLN